MSHKKDNEILYFVSEFHLVTEAQLARLTGRQTLWRRLPVLVREKKLYRTRQGRYAPYVYAAYNITKRKSFDHDLLITDIHIALYQTDRLVQWQQSKDKKEGALNEDASCILAVPTAASVKEMHCFVEADTGSEPDWQIREKIERYTSYYSKHKKPFRVVFVAPDDRRLLELVRVSERSVSKETSRMFLFASIEKFETEPFGAICSICHNENFIRLIPTLLASAR